MRFDFINQLLLCFVVLLCTSACTPSQSKNSPQPISESVFDELSIETLDNSCPAKDPELMPWFPYCEENGDCWGGPYAQDILDYFNRGGTYKNLAVKGDYLDLTGDGQEDYVWRDAYAVFVLGCKNGKYEILLSVPPVQNAPVIEFIEDLNGNGIPELFLSFHERRDFHSMRILEWDGKEFASLIDIEDYDYPIETVFTTGWEYTIQDTNQDQLQEIVFINKPPIRIDGTPDAQPWQYEIITLGWDGQNYSILNREIVK